jgi:two-component system, OmpR family, phosphate regulon sensor histidine kinase PhoR
MARERFRLGIRLRLFVVSVVIIAFGLAAAQWYASRGLDQDFAARTRNDLALRARTVGVALQQANALDRERCTAPVRSLSDASRARITLIDPRGVVRCDSSLDAARVAAMSNHNDRPEIIAARRDQTGIALHQSSTFGRPFVYAAQRIDGPDGQWVVRIAVEPVVIATERATLSRMLSIAALLGLLGAAAMSSLAAQLIAAPVRALTQTARSMVRDLSVRSRTRPNDEVGELAGALDELADGLAASMESLRSERDRLGTILDSMVEGVVVTSSEGIVVVTNRALREMFLRTQDQVIGRAPIAALRVLELHEAIEEAASSGKRTSVEFAVEGVRPRTIAASVAPLKGAQGESAGCVAVLSDVTELRRLEGLRREFVANVSHELRTPVAAVRAAVETLQSGALDDPKFAKEFVAIIERHADRLRRLVEDLLELSRIEAKELQLRPEPLALGEQCEHVVELFALAAKSKKANLSVSIAPDTGRVFADRRGLEHVLTNLVDNAIKYAGEGASVTVRASSLGDERARVSVEDTGPGIEARHLPRLFERFYRVDTGRSRQLGGTGLGLAIVKHMAEAMGAKVSVESEVGKGTRFHVDIPRAPARRTSIPPAASAEGT